MLATPFSSTFLTRKTALMINVVLVSTFWPAKTIVVLVSCRSTWLILCPAVSRQRSVVWARAGVTVPSSSRLAARILAGVRDNIKKPCFEGAEATNEKSCVAVDLIFGVTGKPLPAFGGGAPSNWSRTDGIVKRTISSTGL